MEQKYSQLVLKKPNDVISSHNSNKIDLSKPSMEETINTTLKTKAALEKLCQSKIKSFKSVKDTSFTAPESRTIAYTPLTGLSQTPSNNTRIIKITQRPVDPLENIKFKHRKIPHSNSSEPVPVMHSPQRKVTAQDQKNWKVPPCISSSKNPKGLVIPLDIRIMADGRNLKEYKANPNFSKFADVLFIAEKSARNEIEERNRIQESILMKATLKKEEELKLAAKQARMEKAAMSVSNISSVNTTKSDATTDVLLGRVRDRSLEKEKDERNELRNLRKKEIEYNRRIEMSMKNKKKINNKERDISEKIALGQAQPTMPGVDSRLFSQVSGLDNGFKDDSDNDLYDTPLFNEKNTATNIYKTYYNDEGNGNANSKKLIERIMSKGKSFEGTDPKGGYVRNGPVQFEKSNE